MKINNLNSTNYLLTFFIVLLISTTPYLKFYGTPIYTILITILIFLNLKYFLNHKLYFSSLEIIFFTTLVVSSIIILFNNQIFTFSKNIFVFFLLFIFFYFLRFNQKLKIFFLKFFVIFVCLNTIFAITQKFFWLFFDISFFSDLRLHLPYPGSPAFHELIDYYRESPAGVSYTKIQLTYQICIAIIILSYLSFNNHVTKIFQYFTFSTFFSVIILTYSMSVLPMAIIFLIYIFLDIYKKKNIKFLLYFILAITFLYFLLQFYNSNLEIKSKNYNNQNSNLFINDGPITEHKHPKIRSDHFINFIEYKNKILIKIKQRYNLQFISIKAHLLKFQKNISYQNAKDEVILNSDYTDLEKIFFKNTSPHNNILTSSRDHHLIYLIIHIFFLIYLFIYFLKKIILCKNKIFFILSIFYLFNTLVHNAGIANFSFYSLIFLNIIFLEDNNFKKFDN